MKNRILLILIFVLSNFLIHAQTQDKWVKGEVYIKIKEGSFKQARINSSKEREVTANDLAVELPFLEKNKTNFKLKEAQRSFHFSKNESLRRIYRVQFEDDTKIDSLIKVLSKDPMIEYIERIPLIKVNNLSSGNKTVNSLLLDDDWHLQKIKAYEAWNIAPKSVREVIVAVVDDAVQTSHPDLVDNIVSSSLWRDVANNDSDPNPIADSISHGTHVAGIVAARTNNSFGINSVSNDRVKIMPIKSRKDDAIKKSSITHGYEGLLWAAENGAHILNASWGSKSQPSQTEQAIINQVLSQGIIIIGAAGNDGAEDILYPANLFGVISVANTGYEDKKTLSSNYNSNIDISAPGFYILSTVPFNNYLHFTGTSMSAPLVAGAVGFLKSFLPFDTPQELENIIKSSADNIDGLNPVYSGKLGTGRLNLQKAVQSVIVSEAPTLNLVGTNLNWNSVVGSKGYVIERATGNLASFIRLTIVPKTQNQFTDLNTIPSLIYHYRIRCVNSNTYSNTITTSCPPTNETVSLYNNGFTPSSKSSWFRSNFAKAVKWNLIDKSKTGTVTVGEASKSVILAAKSIWSSKYTTLPKQCFDQNPYGAYVDEMKRIGVLSQSATANDAMTLDILSDMIFKVILDAGATKDAVLPLPSQFIKANSYFSGTVKAKKLADTRTIRYFGNDSQGGQIKTSDQLIYIGQNISRGLFCQVLTGAYETKHYLMNNRTLPQGRLNAQMAIEDDVNDFSTIGYKPEYTDEVPDGNPTMQITGASEIIQSGAQWWVEVNPSLLGNNQQFYWTVEGASQGARLDPYSGYLNFRRIYFTAPVVTSETILNMVIYGSSDDGKAVEIYKQFKVVPIPNNGCITLLTPNISFDRVAGSFTSTKACNIRNGSTSSTATLNTIITGPNAINFYVTPTNTTLSNGSQMSFDVSCNASTVGTYTASLEITQTGLSGCPTKITVPLLANVTDATVEPGLTWAVPLTEGTIFYSGSNIPAGSNNLSVNNIYSGTEFRYQASGGNLTTINSCTITSQATASFPEGMFSKSVRFWARKKDCGTNTATGNWVLTPPMTVIPTPNPNINVVYPNGEEILTSNQMYEIKWSGSSTSSVTLVFSTDGGVTFPHTIATNLTASAGKYNWVIPILSPTLNLSPNNFNTIRIKIISGTFSDVSDGNFGIKPPMYLNPTVQQACDDKGQILITASGGKGPLSYLVTPGNYNTTDIRGLNAGTYTVKVTDATGESIQTTVSVPTYTPRNFSYTKTDATCGGKNGSIKITGFSSGFVPKTIYYQKENSLLTINNNEMNNIEYGTYSLFVVDNIGCVVEKAIKIFPDTNFDFSTETVNSNCGQSDGAIKLTANSSASYLWENNSTSSIRTNLQQGSYFVKVTNNTNGCQFDASVELASNPWQISSPYTLNGIKYSSIGISNNRYLFFGTDNTLKVYNSSLVFQSSINLNNTSNIENTETIFNELNPSDVRNIVVACTETSQGYYKLFRIDANSNVVNYSSSRPNLPTFVPILDYIYTDNIIGIIGKGGGYGSYDYNLLWNGSTGLPNSRIIKKIAKSLQNTFYLDDLGKVWSYYTSPYNFNFSFFPTYTGTDIFSTRSNRLYITSKNSTNGYLEKYLPNSTTNPELFNLSGIPSSTAKMAVDFGESLFFIPLTNGNVDLVDIGQNKVINFTLNGENINTLNYDEQNKRCVVVTSNSIYFIQKTPQITNLNIESLKNVDCNSLGSVALTVTGGGGTPTYSWSNGATTKDISNLTVNTYTVTVTPSDGGCAVRKSIKIENVGVVPTATLTNPANKTSFCVGESVQLVANQGTDLTYQWQKDGTDISGATQQTFYATTTGSYRVKVKNSTGCEAISSATSLTANSLPAAIITPLSSTTICEGNTVTLSANAATNQSYVWLKNDAVIQGQTSQNFVANSAGSYQVITILNGCSNLSSGANVSITPFSPIVHSAGSITANLYQGQNITSQANVPNRTFYRGGTSVVLQPGFQAGANELFLAEIGGCVNMPSSGLVLHLPFDGNTNDMSGNNNNGINTGATLTNDRKGVANAAYNFGGFSNKNFIKVTNSASLQFTNEITISLWFSLNTYAGMTGTGQNATYGTHTLFAKDFDNVGFYGRVFADTPTNNMKLDFVGVPGPSNFMTFPVLGDMNANLNNWIHLVHVLGNGKIKTFKNGVLVMDRTLTTTPNFTDANTKDLYFGCYRGGVWYPLNGKLDDIRIYNRALTDAEVQSIYTIER